jgi:hypothetical protein
MADACTMAERRNFKQWRCHEFQYLDKRGQYLQLLPEMTSVDGLSDRELSLSDSLTYNDLDADSWNQLRIADSGLIKLTRSHLAGSLGVLCSIPSDDPN